MSDRVAQICGNVIGRDHFPFPVIDGTTSGIEPDLYPFSSNIHEATAAFWHVNSWKLIGTLHFNAHDNFDGSDHSQGMGLTFNDVLHSKDGDFNTATEIHRADRESHLALFNSADPYLSSGGVDYTDYIGKLRKTLPNTIGSPRSYTSRIVDVAVGLFCRYYYKNSFSDGPYYPATVAEAVYADGAIVPALFFNVEISVSIHKNADPGHVPPLPARDEVATLWISLFNDTEWNGVINFTYSNGSPDSRLAIADGYPRPGEGDFFLSCDNPSDTLNFTPNDYFQYAAKDGSPIYTTAGAQLQSPFN